MIITKISEKLLKIFNELKINTIITPDMDFLDIDPNDDNVITFININKIKNNEDVWTKNRNKIKIGKFLKNNFILEDKQIENLVNQFKTYHKVENGKIKEIFEIVHGKDIFKYYKKEFNVLGGGSLQNSCMSDADENKLKLYINNPEKIKLLIIKNGDKILSRALLWNTNQGFYIDRPYCRFDKDLYLYQKYSEIMDYKYYYKHNSIINLEVVGLRIPAILPFMDTFKFKVRNKLKNRN